MVTEPIPRYFNFRPDEPLSDQQLMARETWMMTEGNWRGDHYAPSVGEHYRYLWLWDELKGAVINARRGDPDRARLGITTLLGHEDPATGFLPNKIFATQKHKTWRDYPEAWNFNNNRIGTSYTQPPLGAWAALETYMSFTNLGREDEGAQFLQSIYGSTENGNHHGLQGMYAYFVNYRQNSPEDRLAGIVFPNETGRDSDEASKPWLVCPATRSYNPKREWLQMQKLGWDLGRLGRDPKGKRIDWLPEQVRSRYWVNDVMFNTMYAANLRNLADIADILFEHSNASHGQHQYALDRIVYRSIADDVEREILERMWDPIERYFYNLDQQGNKIPVDSVTGMFPLMLEGINETQTLALLDKLEDPTWFNTPYPVPTHAVRSPFFDPDPTGFKNQFTPQWSGPVWTDVNHFIVEQGLVERSRDFPDHATRMLGRAGIIADKTRELIAGEATCREYYSPVTGTGMRVKHFMWTNIGLHFENLEALTQEAAA